jgi:iron complex transport system permease protein
VYHKNQMIFFLILSLSFSLFMVSLLIGEINFTLHDISLVLIGKGSQIQQYVFLQLRLPHTLNAFVIGCLLALSGYLMQITLNNPLADPYTLGSSGGACVFILLGSLFGFEGASLVGCSFLGSLIAFCLLLFLTGNLKQTTTIKLSLVGFILACGWGALLSLLLLAASPLQTKSILYWLFGEIDGQQYSLFSMTCLIFGLIYSQLMKQELNVIRHGYPLAQTLGVNVQTVQIKLILLSTLLTATAVSLGGAIGFIGLVIPHLARSMLKLNFDFLLPCTVFLGGCLLLLADIVARLILKPEQLPIGIVTTLLGLPFFLYLSTRNQHEK